MSNKKEPTIHFTCIKDVFDKVSFNTDDFSIRTSSRGSKGLQRQRSATAIRS